MGITIARYSKVSKNLILKINRKVKENLFPSLNNILNRKINNFAGKIKIRNLLFTCFRTLLNYIIIINICHKISKIIISTRNSRTFKTENDNCEIYCLHISERSQKQLVNYGKFQNSFNYCNRRTFIRTFVYK